MESLVQRAEELKSLITTEAEVSKLVYYATALAAGYRQLDSANILYIE
jgi:hypothetical protein